MLMNEEGIITINGQEVISVTEAAERTGVKRVTMYYKGHNPNDPIRMYKVGTMHFISLNSLEKLEKRKYKTT